ncbi:MAG: hypothetical protein QSU88_00410, partial [Candidatus Methanoperedens sp.]|nr:hypothetical protein [Candidatus Methanoperedens sp.]
FFDVAVIQSTTHTEIIIQVTAMMIKNTWIKFSEAKNGFSGCKTLLAFNKRANTEIEMPNPR